LCQQFSKVIPSCRQQLNSSRAGIAAAIYGVVVIVETVHSHVGHQRAENHRGQALFTRGSCIAEAFQPGELVDSQSPRPGSPQRMNRPARADGVGFIGTVKRSIRWWRSSTGRSSVQDAFQTRQTFSLRKSRLSSNSRRQTGSRYSSRPLHRFITRFAGVEDFFDLVVKPGADDAAMPMVQPVKIWSLA